MNREGWWKVTRSRIRRALKAALIGVALLVLAALALAAWLVRRSWPELRGRLAVPGLKAEVEVVRDTWGVPHIYARDEHDLYLAEGYVHAQDRLWQMHFNRMVASGLLSSFLGPAALEADRYIRTLGLRRAAERDWALLDADTRAALEAYAGGVNAYVGAHRGRLPVEFTLLGTEPAPWTPLDMLTFAKLMALNLGLNHSFELMRDRIARKAGAEAAERFVPPYPQDGPRIVGAGLRQAAGSGGARPFSPSALVSGPAGGSNNWVVHGSRTRSGRPLLANDTHLALSMPSIWYENGLHAAGLDVVGFALPGMPGVVLGRNLHVAWGVSNMCADIQDLYLEKLDDAARPTRYLHRGEWKDLATVEETIPVKGAAAETLRVPATLHGPLLNGALAELKDRDPLALRWSALDGGRLAAAILRLNKARDWESFREALRLWDAPALNFVYADAAGHIGYQSTGRIPARAGAHRGTVPVPGWDGASDWRGFIPFDELPRLFDPTQGFVVTANNKVVDDDYPYNLGVDVADPYRARRIGELLERNARASLDDMKAIQAETYSLPAAALRPYLVGLAPRSPDEARAIALVRDWDLRQEADRVGAAVFNTWYYFLIAHVVQTTLGEELWKTDRQFYISLAPMLIELMAREHSPLFDDPGTPRAEGRDDLAARSLGDAVAWLRQRLGGDMERWTWGRIHQVTFAHQPLGMSGIGPLERLFNGRSLPARGDVFTVDASLPDAGKPFASFFGASQRMIADLARLDGALSVNSTGQSERLFHEHRDDQVEPWERVEYHAMVLSRAAVTAAGRNVLTLAPR